MKLVGKKEKGYKLISSFKKQKEETVKEETVKEGEGK